MLDITIDSKALDELVKLLDRMPDEIDRQMRPVMQAGGELVRGGMAQYPPSSGANAPPGLNGYSWYERGFGTRTVTGRAYPTSEQLGKSWTVAVATKPGQGWVATVGTAASYAPYVQSAEKQASFHAARGWPTDERVLEQKGNAVVALVGGGVDKVLARMAK